jgi:hypothetical protein
MVVRSIEELPALDGVALQANAPSLTQARAELHAGLIHPEFAELVALIWAQVHLGPEARPW